MGLAAVVESELFIDAYSALIFAFNFSGQCYDRPMMNRMATPAVRSGKGLCGLDGAAQSGMIRAEVQKLGKIAEAIIIARIAPRTRPCSCKAECCSGSKPNKEVSDAIAILSDQMRRTALAGCVCNGLMRREYVLRYFTVRDRRESIDSVADRHDIARNTASAHSAKVFAWFAGTPARKDRPAVIGMEQAAFDAIEDRLREIGMVGS